MEASTSSSMEASPSTRARLAASALTGDACVASLVDHAARSNPNGVALSCGSSRSTWRDPPSRRGDAILADLLRLLAALVNHKRALTDAAQL